MAAVVFALTLSFGAVRADAQTDPPRNENPAAIAEEIQGDGVYIASTREDVSREPLVAEVLRARQNNLRLVIVIPENPEPTPQAYARRMQEATDADAAIVFPSEGQMEAYSVEELRINNGVSLDAARQENDYKMAVSVYAGKMVQNPDRGVPFFILGLIVFVVVLVVVAFWSSSLEQQERGRLRHVAKVKAKTKASTGQ